ncbi:MAG TPA: hypothetical protein VF789_05370 [Thermoanaerobaculia bacterium]
MPMTNLESLVQEGFEGFPDGRLETGEPYHPGLSLEEVGALMGWRAPAGKRKPEENPRAPRAGVDCTDLASAGWAAIFPRGGDPAVREALRPLLDRRREQAGALYRELAGAEGLQPGEKATDFLLRQDLLPGSAADPSKLPYYLLLVGGPEEIPWEFHHQLDFQYAVGRLAFDTPEEYALFARAALEAEDRPAARPSRRAVFFGAETFEKEDGSSRVLRELLADRLAANLTPKARDWQVMGVPREQTTREHLATLLAGPAAPDLLFLAGHGLGYPRDHPSQRERQGGLICRLGDGSTTSFTAADLPADPRSPARIVFQYSCNGAGTPRFDAYSPPETPPRELASRPFVARFPQRLLGAGTLAFVGHVERTWALSFLWQGVGSQPTVFEDALLRLFQGQRVGAALETFGQRRGDLLSTLEELRRASAGRPPDALETRIWKAAQDARTYVLLGDPAVRLPL